MQNAGVVVIVFKVTAVFVSAALNVAFVLQLQNAVVISVGCFCCCF